MLELMIEALKNLATQNDVPRISSEYGDDIDIEYECGAGDCRWHFTSQGWVRFSEFWNEDEYGFDENEEEWQFEPVPNLIGLLVQAALIVGKGE